VFEDGLPRKLQGKLATFALAVADSGWSLGGGIFEACHSFSDLFEIRAKLGRDLAREFCTVDGEILILVDGVLKAEGEPTPPDVLRRAYARVERYRTTRRLV
jgi:hypothetical protein